MNIFGDQQWKKIQRFLILKDSESKKSKNIQKKDKLSSIKESGASSSFSQQSGIYTYRSVKAIQSKIYQIKPEVKKDMEFLKKVLTDFEHYKSTNTFQPY